MKSPPISKRTGSLDTSDWTTSFVPLLLAVLWIGLGIERVRLGQSSAHFVGYQEAGTVMIVCQLICVVLWVIRRRLDLMLVMFGVFTSDLVRAYLENQSGENKGRGYVSEAVLEVLIIGCLIFAWWANRSNAAMVDLNAGELKFEKEDHL